MKVLKKFLYDQSFCLHSWFFRFSTNATAKKNTNARYCHDSLENRFTIISSLQHSLMLSNTAKNLKKLNLLKCLRFKTCNCIIDLSLSTTEQTFLISHVPQIARKGNLIPAATYWQIQLAAVLQLSTTVKNPLKRRLLKNWWRINIHVAVPSAIISTLYWIWLIVCLILIELKAIHQLFMNQQHQMSPTAKK